MFRVKPLLIAGTILLALAIAFAGRMFIANQQGSDAQSRAQSPRASAVIVQTAPANVGPISSVYDTQDRYRQLSRSA